MSSPLSPVPIPFATAPLAPLAIPQVPHMLLPGQWPCGFLLGCPLPTKHRPQRAHLSAPLGLHSQSTSQWDILSLLLPEGQPLPHNLYSLSNIFFPYHWSLSNLSYFIDISCLLFVSQIWMWAIWMCGILFITGLPVSRILPGALCMLTPCFL